MATSNANWFGNLINAWLFMILNGIIGALGYLLVLFGSPNFYFDTMMSFGLTPPDAEAMFLYIN